MEINEDLKISDLEPLGITFELFGKMAKNQRGMGFLVSENYILYKDNQRIYQVEIGKDRSHFQKYNIEPYVKLEKAKYNEIENFDNVYRIYESVIIDCTDKNILAGYATLTIREFAIKHKLFENATYSIPCDNAFYFPYGLNLSTSNLAFGL